MAEWKSGDSTREHAIRFQHFALLMACLLDDRFKDLQRLPWSLARFADDTLPSPEIDNFEAAFLKTPRCQVEPYFAQHFYNEGRRVQGCLQSTRLKHFFYHWARRVRCSMAVIECRNNYRADPEASFQTLSSLYVNEESLRATLPLLLYRLRIWRGHRARPHTIATATPHPHQ